MEESVWACCFCVMLVRLLPSCSVDYILLPYPAAHIACSLGFINIIMSPVELTMLNRATVSSALENCFQNQEDQSQM